MNSLYFFVLYLYWFCYFFRGEFAVSNPRQKVRYIVGTELLSEVSSTYAWLEYPLIEPAIRYSNLIFYSILLVKSQLYEVGIS